MYDRVRENKTLNRSMPVDELVEASITQTLVRTINTSTTTTACMLIILIFSIIFKIDSIRVFSLPMFFGLLSGCYSTICIAGPLWVTWQKYKAKKGNGKKAIA
jgi:SecD/SecF fusion protein